NRTVPTKKLTNRATRSGGVTTAMTGQEFRSTSGRNARAAQTKVTISTPQRSIATIRYGLQPRAISSRTSLLWDDICILPRVIADCQPAREFLPNERSLIAVEICHNLDCTRCLRQCIDTATVAPSALCRRGFLVTIQPFDLGDRQCSIAPPGHRALPDGEGF